MQRIKNSCLFRAISLSLIFTFISLDISYAYPPEHNANNSTLAIPSVLQQAPINEQTALFQQSVFSQGALLASVYYIGEYFFGNALKGIKSLPPKHAKSVIKAELRKQLSDMGIEIQKIVPVERIKEKTPPDELKAALDEIGFNGKLPEENVVFILYEKSGKRFLVQIAKSGEVSSENLPGYEWVVSGKYVVKYIPENPTGPVGVVTPTVIASRPTPQPLLQESEVPAPVIAKTEKHSWFIEKFEIFMGSSLGFVLGLLYWYSFKCLHIDPTMAAMAAGIQPVVSYIIATKISKSEKVDRTALFAAIMATLGICVYSSAKILGVGLQAGGSNAVMLSTGVVLLLLHYVAFSFQAVYSHKAQRKYGITSTRLTMLGFGCAIVVGLAVQILVQPTFLFHPVNFAAYIYAPILAGAPLFFVYVLGDVVKWNLQNYSLRHIGASRVQTVLTLVPVSVFLMTVVSSLRSLIVPSLIIMAMSGMFMSIAANMWLAKRNANNKILSHISIYSAVALAGLVLLKSGVTVLTAALAGSSDNWSTLQLYTSTHTLSFIASLVVMKLVDPFHIKNAAKADKQTDQNSGIIYSINPFAVIFGAAAVSSIFSSVANLVAAHPWLASIVAIGIVVATWHIIWRAKSPLSWHLFWMKYGENSWGHGEALAKMGAPAVEPLINALSDIYPHARSSAAQALGKIGDIRAVEPIISALDDNYPNVRSSAAQALGKIGDIRAVEPIIKVLGDSSLHVRYAAAAALGDIGDIRAIEPLIKALSDNASNVRYYATEALVKIGEPAISYLIAELSSDNPSIRSAAVTALDKMGWKPVSEKEIDAYEAIKEEIAREAASHDSSTDDYYDSDGGYGQRNGGMYSVDPFAFIFGLGAVSSMFSSVKNFVVTEPIASGLIALVVGIVVVAYMVSSFRERSDKMFSVASAARPTAKAKASSIEDYMRSLSDKDPEVREAAARSSYALDDPRLNSMKDYLHYISQLYGGDSRHYVVLTNEEVEYVLSRLETGKNIDAVYIPLISETIGYGDGQFVDGSYEVIYSPARLIINDDNGRPIQKDVYFEIIPRLIKGTGRHVPKFVDIYLPILDMGSDAVPALIELLNDEDYNVRKNAAYLLGFIKDKRAKEPLTKALNDDDPDVRNAVEIALEDIEKGPVKPDTRSSASGQGRVSSVSDDCKMVATVNSAGQVEVVIDTEFGKQIKHFQVHSGSVGIAFSSDGKAIGAINSEKQVDVIDIESGKQIIPAAVYMGIKISSMGKHISISTYRMGMGFVTIKLPETVSASGEVTWPVISELPVIQQLKEKPNKAVGDEFTHVELVIEGIRALRAGNYDYLLSKTNNASSVTTENIVKFKNVMNELRGQLWSVMSMDDGGERYLILRLMPMVHDIGKIGGLDDHWTRGAEMIDTEVFQKLADQGYILSEHVKKTLKLLVKHHFSIGEIYMAANLPDRTEADISKALSYIDSLLKDIDAEKQDFRFIVTLLLANTLGDIAQGFLPAEVFINQFNEVIKYNDRTYLLSVYAALNAKLRAFDIINTGPREVLYDGIESVAVSIDRPAVSSSGEAFFIDLDKVEVKNLVEKGTVERDFIDNPVSEGDADGMGKTIKEMIESAPEAKDALLAFNGITGGFWEANSAVIVDGELIAKSSRGTFQDKYVPLNGKFWLLSLDADNKGVFEVEIKDGKLPENLRVKNGLFGPPIFIGGKSAIDSIQFEARPNTQGNQVVWTRDQAHAISAIGYDKEGKLVRVALKGDPNNEENKEITVDDLPRVLDKLGVVDAVLTGASADVQSYNSFVDEKFVSAKPRAESKSAKVWPVRGRPLASRVCIYAKQPDKVMIERGPRLSASGQDVRTLGKTGLKVYSLGIGTIWFGRQWPPDNQSYVSPETSEISGYMDSAFERICNQEDVLLMVDTAAAYGLSEEKMGQYFKDRASLRSKALVATKWGEEFDITTGLSTIDHSVARLKDSVERSFSRLGGNIDLLYIHGTTIEVLKDVAVIAEMRRMKDNNYHGIRYLGASISNENVLEAALKEDLINWLDVVQMPAPIFLNRPDLVSRLTEKKIAIVVNSPIRKGGGRTPQENFDELFKHAEAPVVLTGTRNNLDSTIGFFKSTASSGSTDTRSSASGEAKAFKLPVAVVAQKEYDRFNPVDLMVWFDEGKAKIVTLKGMLTEEQKNVLKGRLERTYPHLVKSQSVTIRITPATSIYVMNGNKYKTISEYEYGVVTLNPIFLEPKDRLDKILGLKTSDVEALLTMALIDEIDSHRNLGLNEDMGDGNTLRVLRENPDLAKESLSVLSESNGAIMAVGSYAEKLRKNLEILESTSDVKQDDINIYVRSRHFISYIFRRFFINEVLRRESPVSVRMFVPAAFGELVHALGFSHIELEGSGKNSFVNIPIGLYIMGLGNSKYDIEFNYGEVEPGWTEVNHRPVYKATIDMEKGKILKMPPAFLTNYGGRGRISLTITDTKTGEKVYELNPVLVTQSGTPIDFEHSKLNSKMVPVTKRFADVMLSFTVGVLSLPVIALLVPFVRHSTKSLTFYREIRPGKDMKPVIFYKLRTVNPFIDANLDMSGFIGAKDPRITWIGRYLRGFGIDELPQLWNIFKGEWSFLGPRSLNYREAGSEHMSMNRYMQRSYVIKPALFGMAEVLKGRSPEGASIRTRDRYNIYYLQHWSMLLDLKLIVYAFITFLLREGRELYKRTYETTTADTASLMPYDTHTFDAATEIVEKHAKTESAPETETRSSASGDTVSAAGLFKIVEAAADAEDNSPLQLEANEGIASLIYLARKAQAEGQKLLIGLETDWVPGINKEGSLQRQAITPLIRKIEDGLKRKGLDNVEIVYESAGNLAGVLTGRADKTHTSLHNIVAMASKSTIYSDKFAPLMNADMNDRPFLTVIDPIKLTELYEQYGELSSKQLY
ncbi:MAG: aldo/keto reductase, partial [Candidatus Omnitrophota bacterium]|nr:aldo/keto reductase [Candidatus Omnitrophota bacterium]